VLRAAGKQHLISNTIAFKKITIRQIGTCLCCPPRVHLESLRQASALSVGSLVRMPSIQLHAVTASIPSALLFGRKPSQTLAAPCVVLPFDCVAFHM